MSQPVYPTLHDGTPYSAPVVVEARIAADLSGFEASLADASRRAAEVDNR